MTNPRLDAARLQSLNPNTWTLLLHQRLTSAEMRVTAVAAEPAGRRANLTRYLLTVSGTSDPITVIGKETNRCEAQFYAELAPQLDELAPQCWFADADGEEGWIVLEDVPNDHPTEQWELPDVEAIIEELVSLHAAFYDQSAFLSSYDWLPQMLGDTAPRNLLEEPPEHDYPYLHGQGSPVSEHALRSAGNLAPRFQEAALGVSLLRDLGGWPGVLDENHLNAAADLLDDPMPMLAPLRSLPVTLLHGNPSIYHWHSTLFNDRRLFDWHRPSVGPAISDLMSFVEQFDLIDRQEGEWRLRTLREQPITEQTIVDAYMVRMSHRLGRLFNAREARRALPSARCLFVLTDWFPQFANWFAQLPNGRRIWNILALMNDDQLAQTNFRAMIGLRPYLSVVFQRFLRAYEQL